MKAAQSKVEEKFCFYRKNYRPLGDAEEFPSAAPRSLMNGLKLSRKKSWTALPDEFKTAPISLSGSSTNLLPGLSKPWGNLRLRRVTQSGDPAMKQTK
jgi:hypothetical protein